MEDAKYTAIPLSWRESSGELRVHESADDISRGLADVIVRASEAAIAAHGSFSIVISGGSVVKCLGQLAHPDIAALCDWSRWHVFWVDERAVPLMHPDSNYLLAHTHWLSKVPIPPAHIHTLDDSLPVEAAAEAYQRELKQCVDAGVLLMHPVEAAAAEAYERELKQFVDSGVLLMHPVKAAAEAYERELLQCVEAGVLLMLPVEATAAEVYERELKQCVEVGVLLMHPAAVVAVVAMGEGKRELLGRLFEAGGTRFAAGTGDGRLIWMVDMEAAAGFLSRALPSPPPPQARTSAGPGTAGVPTGRVKPGRRASMAKEGMETMTRAAAVAASNGRRKSVDDTAAPPQGWEKSWTGGGKVKGGKRWSEPGRERTSKEQRNDAEEGRGAGEEGGAEGGAAVEVVGEDPCGSPVLGMQGRVEEPAWAEEAAESAGARSGGEVSARAGSGKKGSLARSLTEDEEAGDQTPAEQPRGGKAKASPKGVSPKRTSGRRLAWRMDEDDVAEGGRAGAEGAGDAAKAMARA
ncbi:unnamed protein product [Closterium sp. Naga37s-1]|nr:unnamed protein product [Closterium sp. Naga37s-1]